MRMADLASAEQPSFSVNLVADLVEMWSHPFMVNAFRAATLVAVLAAAIGVVMVIRGQTFLGHSFAVIGLPGASGAALAGAAPAVGYYTAAGIAVLAMRLRPSLGGGAGAGSATGGQRSDETATVGTLQSFALALGLLFIGLYHGYLGGTTSLLFGSLLGVEDSQVVQLAIVSVLVLAALVWLWRPLLFVSLDSAVAASRGLRVGLLNLAFLLLLAVTTAAVAQVTGALLVFALLVLPAATAQLLTTRPALSIAVAIGVALIATWSSLFAAYFTPYPVGFWITTTSFALYLLARLAARVSS
jgi:zinc/manganese transport system permease protein